jgi:S-adenosylmethionine hydrolase
VSRPIVFLSDYGLSDEFAGICRAVALRIAPASQVVDLTHSIPPQDVLRGALVLARSVPFLPSDAVVLAVVDPGVGTPRRPVAVETAHGGLMVGPDNGLLSLAWEEQGGPTRVVEIVSEEVVLAPVSATFHGRDIFAPAAAHLAAGMPLERLGPAVDPGDLVRVVVPSPNVEPGRVDGEVLGVDRFGNVQLSARPDDLHLAGLGDRPRLEILARGSSTSVRRAATFGEVAPGEFALIVNSSGWLAVVVNRGNAGDELGLVPGDPVSLRAATDSPAAE